ncbi:hypothetical protein JMI48_001135 [Salmonella enterica]|nr:hypothetical protein [Salmonella enterica]EDE2152100.1 hypothetical protein [Salmonella enterica]EDE9492983.1 hypothetical protein [Salmonella enterica]EHA7523265.1 hypothetical protein [Salmonella enterica]ELU8878060.1 hypothetical protein [Salmonella enterica]
MIEQLPNWKFILIWLVLFVAAIGYLVGQIRWWLHEPHNYWRNSLIAYIGRRAGLDYQSLSR